MADERTTSLSTKQQVFVLEYTACWNATRAAKRAGYAFPNVEGPKNLVKPSIQAAIKARLSAIAMEADEVLVRLAQHARGSMGDFIRVDEGGTPTGFNLGEDAPQHLIKKVSITDKGITFELYDAQAALTTLARHHGLLVDRSEVTGKDGGSLKVVGFDYATAIAPIASGSDEDSDPSEEDASPSDG